MKTCNSMPATPDDLIREVVPYEEYLADVLPADRVQARNHLVSMLNELGLEGDLGGVGGCLPLGFPPEQIRKAYLEELFPDEETAGAYLWALRHNDPRIRAVENLKRDVTERMVKPLSKRNRQHEELLEMIWKVEDANKKVLRDPTAKVPVEMFYKFGSSPRIEDVLDTWADAEISRVRMRRLVRDLRAENVRGREEVCGGTYLQEVNVGMRRWIFAAALVAQASKCITSSNISCAFGGFNRITPKKVLNTIRKAMAFKVRKGEFRTKKIGFLDDLVDGYRLYYECLDDWHNVNHRHDLMLQGIGNMMVADQSDIEKYAPRNSIWTLVREAQDEERRTIHEAFDKWVRPYRNRPEEMKNYYNLAEFAFRYLDDKRKLMGWRLINSLLRCLMNNPDENR